MQRAFKKKGALHHQLGYSKHDKIPAGLLCEVFHAHIGTHVRGHAVTPLLKHRTIAAVNAQRKYRKRPC
jgi:hypothetical protein